MHDALIVGGGPAGLSAALVLGRCRRDILLIDAGRPRNRHAAEIHGYLTRDCTPPGQFLDLARADVARYGVAVRRAQATHAARCPDGSFTVTLAPLDGDNGPTKVHARKLLLATGMRDAIPPLEGIDAFYGASVHHCPYCDGYEHRDRRLVALGDGDAAVGLALALRRWSDSVTACTQGAAVRPDLLRRAAFAKVVLRTQTAVGLTGDGDNLRQVHFSDGPPLDCDALFFNTRQDQRSDLPRQLGCTFKADGGVETSDRQCAGVRGLYVAGDADREVEFVVVAAAQGATAAVAINGELQLEDTGGWPDYAGAGVRSG